MINFRISGESCNQLQSARNLQKYFLTHVRNSGKYVYAVDNLVKDIFVRKECVRLRIFDSPAQLN